MERLTLKGLKFKGYHGYYEEERQQGNDFEVDLTFYAHLQRAAHSDNLQDTIDYQKVLQIVDSIMGGPSVQLIETLANKIGNELFRTFPLAEKLDIAVRKLNPPLNIRADYAEIEMTWQR
jgi:dihydroneopterin aldolase